MPNQHTIAAWTALVTANRRVLETIERALKTAGLPQLSWYDALLELEKAGPSGIRPFALKERLLLPQYSLSRLLDRLEAAQLIDRHEAADDGRGQIVHLTELGLRTRQKMWPVYAETLLHCVEDRLSQNEAAELARLLAKLADAPS